jgi:hypothetical protein
VSSTHIIRRQFLEVELIGTEADGLAVHRKLADLSRDWLTPALEAVLERWVPADEHWFIDRLDIDAGAFQLEDFERGFVAAVTGAIEQYFRERRPAVSRAATASARRGSGSSGAIERGSASHVVQEAFLYFLYTGVLPWWFRLPPGTTLEDCITADGRVEHCARALVEARPGTVARKRLVRQFSAEFLRVLLAAVCQQSASCVQEVVAKLRMHEIRTPTLQAFSGHVWEAAFARAIAGESGGVETLIAVSLQAMSSDPQPAADIARIAQLWPAQGPRSDHATSAPHASREDSAESVARLDLAEGVFVDCAGVVLLHPFLPQLFEALGIANDDRLIEPQRALSLLHFLVTGQRVAPEYELLLPKLLCNVPADSPVEAAIELTASDEEEAAALLAAVIRHWDALGDISIDGLRGSFLIRPGKLSRRGDDDVLQVEARSYDVLLDRLPWGAGPVQLPWMERLLWVEWRS